MSLSFVLDTKYDPLECNQVQWKKRTQTSYEFTNTEEGGIYQGLVFCFS